MAADLIFAREAELDIAEAMTKSVVAPEVYVVFGRLERIDSAISSTAMPLCQLLRSTV